MSSCSYFVNCVGLTPLFSHIQRIRTFINYILNPFQTTFSSFFLYYPAHIVCFKKDYCQWTRVNGRPDPFMPILPEGRQTKTPTTARLLEMFSDFSWYQFQRGGEAVTFPIKLSQIQKQLLRLLRMDPSAYAWLSHSPHEDQNSKVWPLWSAECRV